MPRRRKPAAERLKAKEERQDKVRQIQAACDPNSTEIFELRQLALSPGGLLNKSLRRKAWPRLLGIGYEHVAPEDMQGDHEDHNQVELDVNRSLWKYPEGIRHVERLKMRNTLSAMLHALLHTKSELRYFQGLHEVATVFLIVCGKHVGYSMLQSLSMCHLRDFVEPDLDGAVAHMDLLFVLISRLDPQLYKFLETSQVQPYFCLSWVLTWFSHVLDDLDLICRIYDVLLASHPLMPVYLSTAVIIGRRDEILRCQCEYSAVHSLLSNPEISDLEEVISRAISYKRKISPKTVIKSRMIPQKSISYLSRSLGFQRYQRLLQRLGDARLENEDDDDDNNDEGSGTSHAVLRAFQSIVVGASVVALTWLVTEI